MELNPFGPFHFQLRALPPVSKSNNSGAPMQSGAFVLTETAGWAMAVESRQVTNSGSIRRKPVPGVRLDMITVLYFD